MSEAYPKISQIPTNANSSADAKSIGTQKNHTLKTVLLRLAAKNSQNNSPATTQK
jgi:hypothetical protein